ncbi:MAG: hypothetical protein ACLRP3_01135 [Escherichia sp.]
MLDTLLEHHVAGIVLCPVNSTSEADLQRYANSSTPLLITMRPLDWQQLPVDYVGVDSHAGVREATEYLIQQGHRDIVFIGGLTHHMRYQGYRGDESPWFTAGVLMLFRCVLNRLRPTATS